VLQIASGKLYPSGAGRTNHLRGVLYSNLVLAGMGDMLIVTAAGALLQADRLGSSPQALVYEVTERIEVGTNASGTLISHTIQPYLHDFAVVVSFFLRADMHAGLRAVLTPSERET
jgi:hypothetical protein